MRRNCRLLFSITVTLLFSFMTFAQEKANYKDVLLDGKPAKLNIKTGEITLVNPDTTSNNLTKPKDSTVIIKKEVVDSIVSKIDLDYHIVKDNETLLDIANRYNTTLTALKRANNLETTLVDKGQKLRVKNFDTKPIVVDDFVDSEKPRSQVVTDALEPLGYIKSDTDFHKVLKGQTLYGLSKLYGLTVDELKHHNDLTSNLIKVGQELRIANFKEQLIHEQPSVWIVEKGDTLYSIAKKNGLTVDDIKYINGLTSNLILVGQELKLK